MEDLRDKETTQPFSPIDDMSADYEFDDAVFDLDADSEYEDNQEGLNPAQQLGSIAVDLAVAYRGIEVPNLEHILEDEVKFRTSLMAAARSPFTQEDVDRLKECIEPFPKGKSNRERMSAILEKYDPSLNPKIKFDIQNKQELIEGLTQSAEHVADWHQRLDFESYESNLLRALGISIDVRPTSGEVNSHAHIIFREEGVGFVDNIREFAKLHELREAVRYYPFFEDSKLKPTEDRIYRPKYPGNGRYIKFGDLGTEVLIEMSQDGISITARPTKAWTEKYSEKTESSQATRLKKMVKTQVNFVDQEVPKIVGLFMQILNKEATPEGQNDLTYRLRDVPGYIGEEMWLLQRVNSRNANDSIQMPGLNEIMSGDIRLANGQQLISLAQAQRNPSDQTDNEQSYGTYL